MAILALAVPEPLQQTVNHALDAVLAFSGLSLVLGYGILVLALPLLVLPIALPELSRPRDALWSLVLAALAPLLLLNPLPVFSGGGFGELLATVLMARLATEVGLGRWESLTPEQRTALRHLPRWRRAGTDLVTTVVQTAKTAWSATVEAAKGAWSAVLGEQGPAEQRQHGQAAQKSAQKPARTRKQWIRPDPSDEVQADGDGETSLVMPDVTPDTDASVAPAVDHAPDAPDAEPPQAVDGGEGDPGDAKAADAAPGDVAPEPETVESQSRAEPPEPAVQPSEGDGADAVVGPELEPKEPAPEEPSAPEPAEEPQQAQAVDGGGEGDPGDAKAADAAPGDVAPEPETAESQSRAEPPEPAVQPSASDGADAVGPEPEPREPAPEEPSAPEPAEEPQQAQPLAGAGNPAASQAHASPQEAGSSTPVEVAPEDNPGEAKAEVKPAQPAGGGSSQPAQDGEVVVVSSFDEIDVKLWSSN